MDCIECSEFIIYLSCRLSRSEEEILKDIVPGEIWKDGSWLPGFKFNHTNCKRNHHHDCCQERGMLKMKYPIYILYKGP